MCLLDALWMKEVKTIVDETSSIIKDFIMKLNFEYHNIYTINQKYVLDDEDSHFMNKKLLI